MLQCDSLERNLARGEDRSDSRRLWSMINAAKGAFEATEGGNAPADHLPLSLSGYYQLRNGNEFPCHTTDISPLGLGIKGPYSDLEGEWITAQFRTLGFIEGAIVRQTPTAFVVDIRVTPARLERLSRRLVWCLRRANEILPERRKSERLELSRHQSTLETLDGRVLPCQMLDISAGGAALHVGSAALYLWAGQPVTVDNRHAHVLRYFPGGVVIRFEEAEDLSSEAP